MSFATTVNGLFKMLGAKANVLMGWFQIKAAAREKNRHAYDCKAFGAPRGEIRMRGCRMHTKHDERIQALILKRLSMTRRERRLA